MDGMDEQKAQIALSPGFVPVCAIGASAGGVTALQALFRHLPTDLGLAYVVILHLAPDQPSALAEILSFCTKMPVYLVEDGPTLKRDSVFVIPPDRELVIDGDSVTARPFSEPRGRRAPVDLFFRSIAAARGDGIAVVLSGAGADGALGVRTVKEAGGVVMVQEPAEAEFSSMPQNAIASGAVDFVAPIARLIDRLREVAHSKEAVRSLDMDGAANDLRRIVAFLRARTGHDFSSYKRATVMRRVLRRMQVCRLESLSGYADHLYANPEEAKELFSDLLISVTSFFRDTRAFEALDRNTVKPLFDALKPGSEEGVRGWVVGCATGEEAYSIAMLLLEEMGRRKLFVPIQIFATDLDEGALATAREGRYPRTIEADVSEERLGRFFVDEGTHYRVRKDLRELVLFASHSVLKEPPFMRLDLISCRNLLIYMERSLQQQVYAIFHYGLKLGGSLFLGSAETVDSASDLFAALDREARIYVARPKATQVLPILPQYAAPERFPAPGQMLVAPLRPEQAGLSTALHVASLEQGAPPSALVDDGHNVLHLSPTAGRFIAHSGGPVSNVLPAVVRPELRLDLKFALTRATEQGLPTLTHAAEVAFDGKRRRVALHVVPVQKDERTGRNALVFFLDSGPVDDGEQSTAPNDVQPDEVRRLHAELRAAQEALVASRHNHEASIQDLRAANEELQSMNEEYRSTAEELETSKEELQSINEELHTVNAEMKSKLESISAAHSDLQNLTAATEVGTLFLDGHLRIRMFTPPVAGIFNITATDIGRSITDFTHQLDYDAVERDARQLLAELVPVEREVMSRDGRWYVMRLRPYRTVEDRIDGTVVTFVDITGRRAAEQALGQSERQLRSLARASSQVLYRMSPDWSEMRELLGAGVLFNTERPTDGWFESYIPADERARVRAAIQDAIDTRERVRPRASGLPGGRQHRLGAFAGGRLLRRRRDRVRVVRLGQRRDGPPPGGGGPARQRGALRPVRRLVLGCALDPRCRHAGDGIRQSRHRGDLRRASGRPAGWHGPLDGPDRAGRPRHGPRPPRTGEGRRCRHARVPHPPSFRRRPALDPEHRFPAPRRGGPRAAHRRHRQGRHGVEGHRGGADPQRAAPADAGRRDAAARVARGRRRRLDLGEPAMGGLHGPGRARQPPPGLVESSPPRGSGPGARSVAFRGGERRLRSGVPHPPGLRWPVPLVSDPGDAGAKR